MFQEEQTSPEEQVPMEDAPETEPTEGTIPPKEVPPQEPPIEQPPAEEEPSRTWMWIALAVIAVLIVALAYLAFFRPQEAEEYKIGLSLSTLNNPFFVTLKEGAEEAANKAGVEMIVVDSQNDSAKEATNIEDLIQQGVDAILVNPTDADAIVPSILKANEAGIPVFTIDRGASGGEIVSHIASDNVAGGGVAGKFLCDALGGDGKVVELEGIPGTSAARDRGQGFNTYLSSQCPGLEVVARQTANFDRAEGLSVFENILQAQPEIDGTFAHNDQMILGAIQAAEAAGRAGEIIFVGFDAVDEAIAAVNIGRLAATVAQQPAEMGRLGVETAVKHLNDEDVEDYIPVDLSLVSGEVPPPEEPTEAPPEEATDIPPEEATEIPPEEATEEPMEPFRVGFVTDTGGIDDKSFNTTQWAGVQRAAADFGLEAQFIQSDEATQYEPNLTEFASQGYDLTIAAGFFLGGALANVSAQYPDLMFSIVDYTYPDPFSVPEGVVGNAECIPNVQGQVFKTDQAAFLAGYLAAGMTETGKLGYFGGSKIPTVTIFGVGFQKGMEYYNEVHGTNVQLLGWDNATGEGLFTGDFVDLTKGKESTESLFDEGADIFIPVGGLIGSPGFDTARERGGYGIWVDVDGYNLLPSASDVMLTSVMKNMDNSVYDVIEAAVNGNFNGCGVYVGDLANNGVGIAPYHDLEGAVPDELKAEIEELKQMIISGEIADTGCISYPEHCPGGLY